MKLKNVHVQEAGKDFEIVFRFDDNGGEFGCILRLKKDSDLGDVLHDLVKFSQHIEEKEIKPLRVALACLIDGVYPDAEYFQKENILHVKTPKRWKKIPIQADLLNDPYFSLSEFVEKVFREDLI